MRKLELLAAACIVAAISLPTVASADSDDSFTPAELVAATQMAIDDLTERDPDAMEAFIGYKAWKSGHDARVKIYVSGPEETTIQFDYECHRHGDELECHSH